MTILSDQKWRAHYTSEKHDLIEDFYVRALACAVRYDRKTGYFNARALQLAARGLEGLVRNGGHMRLLVGCTLGPPEIQAIERGTAVRDAMSAGAITLDPRTIAERESLELLAWMVAQGILEVKVAVPCDENRRPVPSDAIFHVKAGVIQDKTGDRISFSGSINETGAGWRGNIESFHVHCEWKGVEFRPHIDAEDENFSTLWADKSPRAVVLDVPAAVRDDLMRFLPDEGRRPARMLKAPLPGSESLADHVAEATPPTHRSLPAIPESDLRRLVWGIVQHGPALSDGERVGEATCAVTPWPHQVRTFERMYRGWPPRLLIADEVGLGKTIEAGLLLRQTWLSGRARRILVLAPKALLRQWQIELREKFNLNWPIYDGQHLVWYRSKAVEGRHEREVGRDAWHREPFVIASSHLMRRVDRAPELLEHAEPYDLVVLDEAHHARRRNPGGTKDKGPNHLLRLMQGLRSRTQGLLLLTATPMQVHPIEVYDLLALLGLPPEWTTDVFLEFFERVSSDNPGHEALDRLCELIRPIEATYGPATEADLIRLDPGTSRFTAGKILRALRDRASTPRRLLEATQRRLAVRFLRRQTPVGRLVSRHTRSLLRRYQQDGRLDLKIAERTVVDRMVPLSERERDVYNCVENYISTTYDNATPEKRNAVGFIMTVYRKRMASSFAALRNTLEDRRTAASGLGRLEEDVSDDEISEESMDTDEAAKLARESLVAEERSDIDRILSDIRRLPTDTKAGCLVEELASLRRDGYEQVIVFTQYTDTVDFLREYLVQQGRKVLCFSGRGGERRGTDGRWTHLSREDTKRLFKRGEADVLLCTDAAAEGLNFQFCGALVNYDMPWNPMRVEQRIGRIDRLGQKFGKIRIVNLLYEDTVETDVYCALRQRIGLFEQFVGRLQPILSRLSREIAHATLVKSGDREQARAALVDDLKRSADAPATGGLDLDEAASVALDLGTRPPALYGMDELDIILRRDDLRAPGLAVRDGGHREYFVTAPGGSEVRVTTSPTYYEEHPESTELWSPGSVVFHAPDAIAGVDEVELEAHRLKSLLSRLE